MVGSVPIYARIFSCVGFLLTYVGYLESWPPLFWTVKVITIELRFMAKLSFLTRNECILYSSRSDAHRSICRCEWHMVWFPVHWHQCPLIHGTNSTHSLFRSNYNVVEIKDPQIPQVQIKFMTFCRLVCIKLHRNWIHMIVKNESQK